MKQIKKEPLKIARNTIYVGCVVKDIKVFSYNRKPNILRNILYTLREKHLGIDLLNEGFVYPLYSPTDAKKDKHSSFSISQEISLEPLLNAMNIPNYLPFEEIKRISNTIFTGKFCLEHYEWFGLDEEFINHASYLKNGHLVYDPRKVIDYLVEYQQITGELAEGVADSNISLSLLNPIDGFGGNPNLFLPHSDELKLNKKF